MTVALPVRIHTILDSEYAETFVSSREWDQLCDEMRWLDEYSTELCLVVMKREALSDGYELSEDPSFDVDKFFWESFNCTEKGLS